MTPNLPGSGFSRARALRATLAFAVMAIAACSEPAAPSPAVLTVTPAASALLIGKTAQLQVSATRDNAPATDETYTYTTDNALIATVSQTGLVTAVSLGTAKVTVTSNSGGSALVAISVIVGPPSEVVKSAGDNQTANVISPVLMPPSVVVKDEVGTPVPGASVVFAVASGGGSVTGALATTNANGVASVGAWTLGTAGENTLTASVDGATAATFTATATQPVIAVDISSLAFTGTANGVSPAAKTIAITNTGNGPLAGLSAGTINYSAGASGWLTATLNTATAPATLSVTPNMFGLSSGIYAATISLTGSSAAPRSVTVTLTVNPQIAASVSFLSQELLVKQNATVPFTATIRDVDGNAMPGAITYASRATSVASINSAGHVTGNAPGQAVIVGTVSSIIADSVLAIVTGSEAPIVVSSLAGFNLASGATHTVSIYVDMTLSKKKLSSGQIDITWTVPQLVYQSHAAGASVGATVNASSAAAGSLRVSFADPAGLTGKVEVLKITFTNSATAGLVGELKLSSTELTATDLSDLNASAVKVTRPLIVK
ncbi:MAG TPA: Ig-like domain-containing protein [Gemmatimonadaceae bacterium]|nr:Ig-like domain-containing protein [Gemmatimonadaceae bacterium]